jgi:hypothetical protein
MITTLSSISIFWWIKQTEKLINPTHMEPIIIEGTPKTPTVKFDAAKGVFEIKGRSIPENSVEFYKPLVDWLDSYKESQRCI